MSEIIRKLATIEKIKELHPITGADAIERAVIRGWNIVVKKGEHKVGDLIIYCEIDSLMPERPEFEFLKPRGYRIRTIKLRGQISQGIAFPLSILPMSVIHFQTPEGPAIDVSSITELGDIRMLEPGTDVTDILGVTKWDPPLPACLGGVAKGRFPSHSLKTDESRIQNLIDVYEYYKSTFTWIATEKLDGCLDENSVLETEVGFKTIKEVCESKYIGKIKSFDLESNKVVWKKVVGHSIKENKPMIKTRLVNKLRPKYWFDIELDNGKKIILTENHEIWISNLLCWRRVDELDGSEEFLLKN